MTERNPYIGAKCTVAKMLASFDQEANRKKVEAVMDNTTPEDITPADAALFAEELGFPMSAAIIRRHRRRITGRGEKCWCPK